MSNTVVNTNILALNSHRSLKSVGVMQAKASQRLSTGMKINSGADDAAGLAISEKMRSQVRGLDMASKNSQDAISLVQVADGGMQEIDNMVQRIRELTVQAANHTNETLTDADTTKLASEASHLIDEIDAMANRTEYNKQKLLLDSKSGADTFNGPTGSKTLHMQVGANRDQSMAVVLNAVSSSSLCLTSTLSNIKAGGSDASNELSSIDEGLKFVVKERAKLGAYQNRLEYTIKSLDTASENTSAAESRIRDTDMAKEMMQVSKANVLQQAATSMLSQANQAPQNVLQLLR